MWPPLLRILLDEPELLTRHSAAYTALVKQEATLLQAHLVKRAGYLLVLLCGAVLGFMFLGIALMLYAVSEGEHGLLWIVPAVPLALALVAGWSLWSAPRTASFPRTRAQMNQDMQLFGFKEPEQ